MSVRRLIGVWFTLAKFDQAWRSVKKFRTLSESLKRNQAEVTSILQSALIVESTSVLDVTSLPDATSVLEVTSVNFFIPTAHFIHKVHLTPGAGLPNVHLRSSVPSIDIRQHCYINMSIVQRSMSFFIFGNVLHLKRSKVLPNMYFIYTINSCSSELLSVKSSIWSSFRI